MTPLWAVEGSNCRVVPCHTGDFVAWCKGKAIAGFIITGDITSYPQASAQGQITRFRRNRFWLRFWCWLRIRCRFRRRFRLRRWLRRRLRVWCWIRFHFRQRPCSRIYRRVSEEDPEPPPSQPANRVALKIAAKSDFLYLNFLFINNASDKTMLKNS